MVPAWIVLSISTAALYTSDDWYTEFANMARTGDLREPAAAAVAGARGQLRRLGNCRNRDLRYGGSPDRRCGEHLRGRTDFNRRLHQAVGRSAAHVHRRLPADAPNQFRDRLRGRSGRAGALPCHCQRRRRAAGSPGLFRADRLRRHVRRPHLHRHPVRVRRPGRVARVRRRNRRPAPQLAARVRIQLAGARLPPRLRSSGRGCGRCWCRRVISLVINPVRATSFTTFEVDPIRLAISTFLSGLITSALMPIPAIGTALLYFDLRWRRGEPVPHASPQAPVPSPDAAAFGLGASVTEEELQPRVERRVWRGAIALCAERDHWLR